MKERIIVYYSQGRYWGYTQSTLNKMGPLPAGMDSVFSIESKKGESLSKLKKRTKKEARDRAIHYIVNL